MNNGPEPIPYEGHGHPPTQHQTGLAALFLRLMGSKPFDGGTVDESSGAMRLITGYSSLFLFPLNHEDTEFGLIDTGSDPKAEEILAVLATKGLNASMVKAIFLTHSHPDHTAGLRQFPWSLVYVSPEDQQYIEGKADPDGPLLKFSGRHPERAIYDPNKIRIVRDGQVITIGERSIRAFRVPGHTRGSIAYLMGTSLFVGDAASVDKKGRVVEPPQPVSFDIEQAIRSLRALVERLDHEKVVIETVIPSHSNVCGMAELRAFVGADTGP